MGMALSTDQDRAASFSALLQALQAFGANLSSAEAEQLAAALKTSHHSNGFQTEETPQVAVSSRQSSQATNDCYALVKEFEGFKQQLSDGSVEAYRDPVGIWTIGWGSTRNLDDNRPIRSGDVITQATAERWLQDEINQTATVVEQLCTVPIKQCMFDALVSFGYNVGTGGGGFRTSTLLKKLNARDYEGAACEFRRWVHGEVNGQKVELAGLVRRRKAEEALFRRDGLTASSESSESRLPIAPVEERQYQPAPLPLPFDRILQEGAVGDDCFLLNCALAGLGFLRVGPQPVQFTSVTKDAVELFQRREKLSINGDVGPTTKQALERALGQARSRVAPRSPDLVCCKLTRTQQPAYQGLEWCKLDFVNPQGQVLDSLRMISGAPGKQRFKLPKDSVVGSGEPIPQGSYAIGDIDWAGGKDNYNASFSIAGDGLGPVWVPLAKKQFDDRDAFGIHGDWNWIKAQNSPGSSGCVCASSLDDLKQLVALLRKHDPRELIIYWGL
jgi:lysozyme